MELSILSLLMLAQRDQKQPTCNLNVSKSPHLLVIVLRYPSIPIHPLCYLLRRGCRPEYLPTLWLTVWHFNSSGPQKRACSACQALSSVAARRLHIFKQPLCFSMFLSPQVQCHRCLLQLKRYTFQPPAEAHLLRVSTAEVACFCNPAGRILIWGGVSLSNCPVSKEIICASPSGSVMQTAEK